MSALNEEIMKIFKDQIEVEKQAIKELQDAANNSKNGAVKLILKEMVYDSMKHQDLSQGIIDIVSEKFVLAPEKDEIKKSLGKHLALEKKAVDNLKKLVTKVKDPTIMLLIKQMIDDEDRHHKLLEKISTEPRFCCEPQDFLAQRIYYNLPRSWTSGYT